ncbi:hypothetical protein [Streptomyces sp. NPDC056987]|uniref:hypothetical protein n=1 Tax=Streptomyces sp. NPDC056987 TaxID=3345988 RepID=UPI00362B5EFB
MPRTQTSRSELSVIRYGAFVSRTTEQLIASQAVSIRSVVHDHFARRSLGAVQICLTKPRLLRELANRAQGQAAKVPEHVWTSADQEITRRPRRLLSATVIAPKGAMWMLVNVSLVRNDPQQLRLALLRGFIGVDQLIRPGAREERIFWIRHEMGVHPLTRRQEARARERIRDDETETHRLARVLAARL